jgi:hypothetical protein
MRSSAVLILLALAITAGAANTSDGLFANTTPKAVVRPIFDLPGSSTTDLKGLLQSQGLFDSSRLESWQSYSFEMTSSGGRTSSAGLLIQHLKYQISRPLTLYMEVGVLHNPLGMAGMNMNGPQEASVTIPAFDLIYRPTDNMTFQFHFSQTPYSSYGDPLGSSRGILSPMNYGSGLYR